MSVLSASGTPGDAVASGTTPPTPALPLKGGGRFLRVSPPPLRGRARVGGAPPLAVCAALWLVTIASPALAQTLPADIAGALESEVAASRNAANAARSGAHGNALLAERQLQTARERGNAALAAIVVDGVARYPAQANDIINAAVTRAPESRAAVLNAVQRAYPTFGVQAQAAMPVAAPASRAAAPPARGAKGAAVSNLPPDVEAELQRAARPAPDGAKAVAGASGNQPLAQRFAAHDERQVGAAMSGTVVTAIARYPERTRDIVAAAVALAPQARPTIEAQAVNAYPAFVDAIRAGAANPGLVAAAAEPERRSKRREQAGPEEMWDPIEQVNRGIFAVNDVVDQFLLRPVAWVYSYAPDRVKLSVRNFFSNLGSPALFGNDLLQGEIRDAAVTFSRFGVNSTIGIGGLFDPAEYFGLPPHHADFGQTLHQYGVGPGPYIVLPLFGPSTLRDAVGRGADSAMRPEGYLAPTAVTLGLAGGNAISAREELLKPLDDLRANSLDYYATLRSAYYQNRVKQLNRQTGGFEKAGAAPSTAPSNTETDKLFDEAK
jgi:phospholipid-binding lipoprotein MlaA